MSDKRGPTDSPKHGQKKRRVPNPNYLPGVTDNTPQEDYAPHEAAPRDPQYGPGSYPSNSPLDLPGASAGRNTLPPIRSPYDNLPPIRSPYDNTPMRLPPSGSGSYPSHSQLGLPGASGGIYGVPPNQGFHVSLYNPPYILSSARLTNL